MFIRSGQVEKAAILLRTAAFSLEPTTTRFATPAVCYTALPLLPSAPWCCSVILPALPCWQVVMPLSLLQRTSANDGAAMANAMVSAKRAAVTIQVSMGVRGVVVVTLGELNEHARFFAYAPRIMTRWQHHDVARPELLLRTVVHRHL